VKSLLKLISLRLIIMKSFKNWLFGESTEKNTFDVYGRQESNDLILEENRINDLNEIEEIEKRNSHSKRMSFRNSKKYVAAAPGVPNDGELRNSEDKQNTFSVNGYGQVNIVTVGELKKKAATLHYSYNNHYQQFLDAPKFWNELQKIKHEKTRMSYHDLFLDKIVMGDLPIETERKLTEYGDVIETAYELAKRYKLIFKRPVEKKIEEPVKCEQSNGGGLWYWLLY